MYLALTLTHIVLHHKIVVNTSALTASVFNSLRLLPSYSLLDSSADPHLASLADPKLNCSSDSVSRSLPLFSCSLLWSFGSFLPLKFGTSRCHNPSAPDNCCNWSRPRGLVKMSAFCRSVETYSSSTSLEREDTLADKMIVHLNVLSPGMEDEVLCKLDVAELVTVDCRRIRHLHLQILK